MKKIENIPGSFLSLSLLYGGLLLFVFGIGRQVDGLNTTWLMASLIGISATIIGYFIKKKEQINSYKKQLKDQEIKYLEELTSEPYMQDTEELSYIKAEIKERKTKK